MTLDVATVLKAVESWPLEDRLELLDRLCEGLPDDDGPPPSDAWKAELDRRLKLSEAHPEAARPWDEVYAELRGRR